MSARILAQCRRRPSVKARPSYVFGAAENMGPLEPSVTLTRPFWPGLEATQLSGLSMGVCTMPAYAGVVVGAKV